MRDAGPSRLRPAIDALFGRGGFDRFLREFWPARVFVHHAPCDVIGALLEDPAFASIEAFFASNPPNLRAWFTDRRFALSAIRIASARDASAAFHGRHMTVIAEHLQAHIPAVARLLGELAARLGISRTEISCNAYLSPAGIGSRMHFDDHEVMVLQVLGKKRWQLGRNDSVQWPSDSWNGGALDATSRLARQLSRPLPRPSAKMRRGRSVILRPGSLVVLPRGTYHQTEALAESLSLTITPALATWHQLMLRDLAAKLDQIVEWRQPVLGIGASQAARAQVRADYANRLRALAELLQSAEPEDLHPRLREVSPSDADALLVPRARGAIRFQRTADGGVLRMLGRDEGAELVVEPVHAAWCAWFAAQRAGTTLNTCLRRAPDLEAATVLRIVRTAMTHGALLERRSREDQDDRRERPALERRSRAG